MREVIRSVLVLVLLGFFTVVAAQLPPEVMADRYLLRAERFVAEKDDAAAREAMNQIVALQKAYDLTLADAFYFRYAQVAFRTGLIQVAVDAVNQYLAATGREGKFYREALALLDEVEQIRTTVDRHLARAERFVAEKDDAAAREAMNQIVALQKAYDLTLADAFYFRYAQVAFRTGLIQVAVDAVNQYLAATGTAGGFHQEALALLDEARQMMLPLEPEMVVIPAGRFWMGCVSEKDCYDEEMPVHMVMIGSFALSKYEVTFEEYDRFTAATGRKRARDGGWGRGRRPVAAVAWNEAVAYTEWLSAETGLRYRLPTEAEWEYAARAGSLTAYSWGNEVGRGRANCDGCGSQWDNEKTAPVGSFRANAWGLHDMHGNVSEWVQDCWHDNYRGAPADGSAWESGDPELRVFRGGSLSLVPTHLRVSYRSWFTTGLRNHFIGFRVARTITP